MYVCLVVRVTPPHLLPFAETKLVLPPGLEVVERHKQLRVAVLLQGRGQQVLPGGPPGQGQGVTSTTEIVLSQKTQNPNIVQNC